MRLLLIVLSAYLLNITNVKAQGINIIPRPQKITIGVDSFVLNRQVKINYVPESKKSALYLQKQFKELLGGSLELVETKKPKANGIQFKYIKDLSKEGYKLIVSKNNIQIWASNGTGWFYGVQSLIQLLSNGTNPIDDVSSLTVPSLIIQDTPRFPWRAFMLDESRHFKGMDQVKKLLGEMAYLKMNVFHWHLVDDQGWRIEIKKYPLLTEIGAERSSTQVGPLKWNSPIQTGEAHKGFYTQEQIKEIVQYAAERHITVVPEIEMPGHSSAAIASYSWLGTTKKETNVPVRFGIGAGTDVYDVSNSRVYQFLTDVLDEVMALFPSQVIHIGGDEVEYSYWKSSRSVAKYMDERGLQTPAELQIHFTNSISQYLKSKGRRMMGWNDILGDNIHDYQDEEDTKSNQELAPGTVVHFWKGDIALATKAVSDGFEIVNSLHSETYLDYAYDNIDLARAYAFDPIPKGLDKAYHPQVIGTGCQMWTEWTPTIGQMHYQIFPRIAAYAEVGWTELKHKNYNNFKVALKGLEQRWGQKGIRYAPRAFVEKKTE
ncbi:beta-N-acetylhexosaminidase [Seonamhaeicola sp.]|uniref:beta-N-acetylhexosaminidase n=1 Tax=Seonamhaeicola sp. TaxID=1912245 RepID=UPI002610D29E|nr:beta-N-acetylhexosaminidase [Seonamhaeicola sp.]